MKVTKGELGSAFDELLTFDIIKVQLEGWIKLFEEYLKDEQIALSRVQGLGHHLSLSEGAIEALKLLDIDTEDEIKKIFANIEGVDENKLLQGLVRSRMKVMLKAFRCELLGADKFRLSAKKIILEGVVTDG